MRSTRFLLPLILSTAALLSACGGGDDKPVFGSVVSFGDSLSDVGTYQVGTIAALGGGKFTVNGTGGKVWTEFLSESLGTPTQCAARTGLLPNNGVTGAAVTDRAACLNYAQGSSRVNSSGTGPNGVALQAYGQQNLGFMADSLKDQMDRHLAKIGGAYTGQELVTVNAGGNDLFMQMNGIAGAAGGGPVAVAGATIAGWPQSTIDVVALGGANATNAAINAAGVAMGQAGATLATYVKTLVLAKGAQFVIVRNLADVSLTPYGLSLDVGTRGLVNNLVQAFNAQLTAGLSGSAGLIVMDDYAQSADALANPAKYGFANVTTPNCGPNNFGGSSIICNTTNLIAGVTTTYAFADSVHPTPYAHLKEAEKALELMVAAGWR